MTTMVKKAGDYLIASRRSTGLTAYETEDGKHYNTFIAAPSYVFDTQPAKEDPVSLGRDLRHHLTKAQLTVNILKIYVII